MLSVRQTASRTVMSLDGIWEFLVDTSGTGRTEGWPSAKLPTSQTMAVPASYNDIIPDVNIRDHVGEVWYQRKVLLPNTLAGQRIILRFGSVTHAATVWVNGVEVARHVGGYLPFEADITDQVTLGSEASITVACDNRLSWQTIPPGTIYTDDCGKTVQKYMHDFYNYAGIHRSVQIYTRPAVAVTDVTVVTTIDGTDGIVDYSVTCSGDGEVSVNLYDENDVLVASRSGAAGQLRVTDAQLWFPGAAYLYRMEIQADEDQYPLLIGIREVTVADSQLLINGKPVYLRGYGRHEDNIVRGKQHDKTMMVHDFELMKWQGANSFRTSHYPYDEAELDYADRHGIMVIDETAAVGMNTGVDSGLFGSKASPTFSPETINDETQRIHADHIRELIARDKNHPCVIIWSIANEPESNSASSRDYFKPLAEVARAADPTRPVGYVNIMLSPPALEKCTDLFDVIMLNRYYSWYVDTGDVALGKKHLVDEIAQWVKGYPGKPIIFTEYGADTLQGNRDLFRRPWSEEFEIDMLGMFHEAFDQFPEVIGEQMWNFADFMTVSGIIRVGGNKKGMFARDRSPKQAAYSVRERWTKMRDELGH